MRKELACLFLITGICAALSGVGSVLGESLDKARLSGEQARDVVTPAGVTGRRTDKAYATENVIIVIIDGLRNEEAFDDPTHQYIPRIWERLRPQGTIYTEMYTLVQPLTSPGHLSIVTGARNNLCNTNGYVVDAFRVIHPTMFECYRKQKNLPSSETRIASGKVNLSTCDHSLHPLWGADYAAIIEFGTGEDTGTMQIAFDRLDQKPSLFLINLEDVDRIGHQGPYEAYTSTILHADTLVYELWQEIQSRPDYRDKTTLMITTDHGRDEDDFRNHGDPTHSDRHVLFLVLGPDIKRGAVITSRVDLIDIAPTVSELLGFQMPFAEGRILHEMFISYSDMKQASVQGTGGTRWANLSQSVEASTYPSITSNADGLHVVWSERDDARIDETRRIKYRRSPDFGSTWGACETVIEGFNYYNNEYKPPDATQLPGYFLEDIDAEPQFSEDSGTFSKRNGTPVHAAIRSGGGNRIILAVSGYSELSEPVREFFWGINLLDRDHQRRWVERGFENRGRLVVAPPAVAVLEPQGGLNCWLTWTETYNPICLGHALFYEGLHVERSILCPAIEVINSPWGKESYGLGLFKDPAIAVQDGFVHLLFAFLGPGAGDIHYSKFDSSSYEKVEEIILDSDRSLSIDPVIESLGSTLYVLWADNVDNNWKILFRKSADNGVSFGPVQALNAQSGDGWQPDMAVHGDYVAVVWEDYSEATAAIRTVSSADGGNTWGDETIISSSSDLVAHPGITAADGAFHIVWQGYVNDNWEIYYSKLDL